MTEATPKACPFCGHVPKTVRLVLDEHTGMVAIRCAKCLASGPLAKVHIRIAATVKWNRRTP